jgi:hypothetical protein
MNVLEGLLVLSSSAQRDPKLGEELVGVRHHTAPKLCVGKHVAGMVSTHKSRKSVLSSLTSVFVLLIATIERTFENVCREAACSTFSTVKSMSWPNHLSFRYYF